MTAKQEIRKYITNHPEAKSNELQVLHKLLLKTLPKCKLWFTDGKNSEGKVVTNPNIGYGSYTIKYADARADGRGGRGTSREFYQIGLSANTTGVSVYILGLKDKTYLKKTFENKIGKARVTGYCIKFRTIKAIDLNVLMDAVRYGVEATK